MADVSILFTYDPQLLGEVDPTTSEGQAAIKEMILEALRYYSEVSENASLPSRERAIIGALLGEDVFHEEDEDEDEDVLREAYLAQCGEDVLDSHIEDYLRVWEELKGRLGHQEALAIYWRMQEKLPRERRSCDPEGNW